jgi:MFS family permease
VIAAIIISVVLLAAFPFIERKVKYPVFRFEFFKIRAFMYANPASFISAIARGGVMFMLILLLQGIWLSLHGYKFEDTPFWAGIYMLPMIIGFIISGPTAGILSDKYGPRWIATGGMVVVTFAFIGLALMPYSFDYWMLGGLIFLMGIGMGMFTSPNSSSIMIGAVLSGIAAVLSAMRGERYVHEIYGPASGAPKPAAVSVDGGAEKK